jgi:serine/threonine protein kinase
MKWFIILEFCPCTLQVILDNAPDHKLPERECNRYFSQLIEGVDYLHSQKVVRMQSINIDRDIKPGNLLVTTDGVLKITDFGIAEQFDFYSGEQMISNTFAGTHQFVSPEVINDENGDGFDGIKGTL